MKKILTVIFLMFFCTFLFFYQTPIIEETEAASIALNTLKNPPPEYKFDISITESLGKENIETYLTERKKGFVSKILNRQQWAVLINSNKIEVTIYINAYNGELLYIIGSLN